MHASPSHPVCRARLEAQPILSILTFAHAKHGVRFSLAVVNPLAAKFGRGCVKFADLPDRFCLRRNTCLKTTQNQEPKHYANRPETRSLRQTYHSQAHHFGWIVIA